MDDIRSVVPSESPRFIHCVQRDMRDKGYAYQTEKTYIHWIKRFIFFHKKQHPTAMGAQHINQFLSFLGNDRHCSPATQRIALNALIYLYRKYLQIELEALNFEKSRQRRRLPVVLTHSEVNSVLEQLQGKHRLMVEILYGSGLRLNELLSLRIKDLDFALSTITVRSGKGDKDRVTLLPQSLIHPLQVQVKSTAYSTSKTCATVMARSTCLTLWPENTLAPPVNWVGSSCSPQRVSGETHAVESCDVTICITPPCENLSGAPGARPISLNRYAATLFGTALPLACCSRATTYVPSRSCLATAMCAPQKYTHTCLGAVPWV